MPDISTINNVAVADIDKFQSITFAAGQKVNNQDVSLATEAHTLISTHTASASSSLDITSGIDSTYDVYEFIFTNMHPATNETDFSFQVNAASGSGFNETITSTFFVAYHDEDDGTGFNYDGRWDQAQGTGYQPVGYGTGTDNDASCSGTLTLYAPSSTTYVKHFIARAHDMIISHYSADDFAAGYINTTSAIDEISFKFSSGNIDSGVVKMYGIAKS